MDWGGRVARFARHPSLFQARTEPTETAEEEALPVFLRIILHLSALNSVATSRARSGGERVRPSSRARPSSCDFQPQREKENKNSGHSFCPRESNFGKRENGKNATLRNRFCFVTGD